MILEYYGFIQTDPESKIFPIIMVLLPISEKPNTDLILMSRFQTEQKVRPHVQPYKVKSAPFSKSGRLDHQQSGVTAGYKLAIKLIQ